MDEQMRQYRNQHETWLHRHYHKCDTEFCPEVLNDLSEQMKENSKKMQRLSQRVIQWNVAIEYLVVPYKPTAESKLKGVSHVVAYRFSRREGDRWKPRNHWVYNNLHIKQVYVPVQLDLFPA